MRSGLDRRSSGNPWRDLPVVNQSPEEVVIGVWKGKTIAESIPRIGGGSPAGTVIAALIMTIALIPFFAFRELSRVLGKGVLAALFLKAQPDAGVSAK